MHGVCDETAEDRDRCGDLDKAQRQVEVDHAAAVIADESRQEAEGLRQQRRADRCEGRRQYVFGTQDREQQHEDGREKCGSTDAAQHRAGRDADCHGKHEPVERKIH